MMRPKRIDEGADQELIVGLLGAKVALDGIADLLAWITADAGGRPAVNGDSGLVEVLLGLAALSAAIDRQPPDPREPEAGDPPVPAGTAATKELLR